MEELNQKDIDEKIIMDDWQIYIDNLHQKLKYIQNSSNQNVNNYQNSIKSKLVQIELTRGKYEEELAKDNNLYTFICKFHDNLVHKLYVQEVKSKRYY